MLESLKDENGQIKKPILIAGLGGAGIIGLLLLKGGGSSSGVSSTGQTTPLTPDLTGLQSAITALANGSATGDGQNQGSGFSTSPTTRTSPLIVSVPANETTTPIGGIQPSVMQPVTAQPSATSPVASVTTTTHTPALSTTTIQRAPAPIASSVTTKSAITPVVGAASSSFKPKATIVLKKTGTIIGRSSYGHPASSPVITAKPTVRKPVAGHNTTPTRL